MQKEDLRVQPKESAVTRKWLVRPHVRVRRPTSARQDSNWTSLLQHKPKVLDAAVKHEDGRREGQHDRVVDRLLVHDAMNCVSCCCVMLRCVALRSLRCVVVLLCYTLMTL